MNVMVVGGGGREHALVWKIAQSPRVGKVVCCPGNPGIARLAVCLPFKPGDITNLLKTIKDYSIDLAMIGPEAPLVLGLADVIRANGILAVGPGSEASKLESSKIYAKNFMRRHDIPTAEFEVFNNAGKAIAFIHGKFACGDDTWSIVKADGLCQGKGVKVCDTPEAAQQAVNELLERKAFGEAGEKVIIEKRLYGNEMTVMAFCDGKNVAILPASQDHKRLNDGESGPNTGGMGAYAPVTTTDGALMNQIKQIVSRFINGLREDHIDYRGVIYFGLMLTKNGPMVLEFNVRFGDPETQAVLPLIDCDFADLLEAVAAGHIGQRSIPTNNKTSCCVVIAAKGYPEAPETGKIINGLDDAGEMPGTFIFHAGTTSLNRNDSEEIVTNGGRVIGVSSWRNDASAAIAAAYLAVSKINFEGMHYRRDIGAKALRAITSTSESI